MVGSRGRVLIVAEPVDQYLRTFSWNKVKYRADKSLSELIDLLSKVRAIWYPEWDEYANAITGGG